MKTMRQNASFLKLAGIVILVLALILVAVLMIFRNKKTTTSTEETTTDQTTTETNTSTLTTILDQSTETQNQFSSFETKAYNKAKEWKSSASLCAVSIKLTGDLNPQSITYSFIFCTSQEKNYYFNINYNTEGQFLRALVWQTDYLQPDLPPIGYESFKKADFPQALELTEQNGGQIFRSTNTQSTITLNLYRSGNKNYLYWFVKYESQDGVDQLNKKIDVYSGQIVSE